MSDKGMHVDKNNKGSVGHLSFLGGSRKIGVGAEKKKESLFGTMFSAMRWTIMISMLLWWFPFACQVLAGYIGGRKAGSSAKGMVSALLSALILIGVTVVISSGFIGGFDFLNTEPSEAIAALGMDFPLLGTVLEWMLLFLQGAMGTVTGTTSMKLNIYIITVVFGLIGGITAELRARETARKTPEEEGGRRFMPRSLAAYVRGKKLGFENFDDRLSMQQSKAQEQPKIVTVHRSLVRRPTAVSEPAAIPAEVSPAVQEAEERESPFAGLIHRAEKNDPEKERVRHSNSKDDTQYV
ncbi:MAG: hypothetical protein LBE48_05240 [Methanomassiliicoccaceae archaeon]|jgi:hypothetical protein|nr:hypothetical protein [Methanomassiliicoccaceae archaeon]